MKNNNEIFEIFERFLEQNENINLSNYKEFLNINKLYTKTECRNMVFDYAKFVIDCMDGKEKSTCVGIWFDKNKKK